MPAPAPGRLVIRAASENDLAAVLAFLECEQETNPWIVRTPELFREAVAAGADGEYLARVAERDGEFAGLAVYGMVAGTIRTAMLYSVVVAPGCRREGIGLRILHHVTEALSSRRARVIFAEVPGHLQIVRYRALLIARGFVEETRIDDYYTDGVPQILSRFDL